MSHEDYIRDLASRVGCQMPRTEPTRDINELLSQPVPQLGGHTIEALIRDLYGRTKDAQVSELRNEIHALSRRIQELEKDRKTLRWCAKRIRRMLRRQDKRN